MSLDDLQKIKDLAQSVSEREGCQLYDVEFSGHGGSRVLRIMIDKENGVSIDDCSNVSRGLDLLLDVEDAVSGGKYDLEVSSPGIERPLREHWHFQKVLGQKVRVITKKSIEDKDKIKTVEGDLKGISKEEVEIQVSDKFYKIPFENIHKAKTVYSVDSFNNKKRKGK